MRILEKKLFRDLRDLKAQVFTLAVLVICGVSVLVSSWSAYRSLKKSQADYYEQYNFADVFVDFERASSDILYKISRISGIERVEGRIVEEALLEVPGVTEPAIGRFVSWDQRGFLNKIYLIEGRLPEKAATIEVLVHQSFAKAHKLRPGDHLVVFFRGQKTRVQISGVGISPEFIYSLSPVAMLPDDRHFGIFWMPSDVLAQLSQMTGAYNNLVVRAAAGASLGDIKMQLDGYMKPFGSLGSYDRDKQMSHVFVENEINEQKSLALVIPAIFVLVGAFILNVVMSRLISLQRSQICILKALGYGSDTLAWYYWKLITVILVIGIVPAFVLGYAIGHWYTVLYADYFHFPKLNFAMTTETLLLGLFVGLVPGWLSSARSLLGVFRLAPAEGMRPPSPPAFHHGLLEKMGLLKSRSIWDRMIFRDLFFRPLRSFAAVVGIAAAVAIMVNGSFWMDIIDFMMKRQFEQVNREDVEVRFVSPRPRDVLNELSGLPGIYYVEGSRNVVARLVFRNISKETEIVAYQPDSQLRRVMDKDGAVLAPSQTGVLLSTYFQRKYGIEVGDRLKFEVLLGEQPTLDLVVTGFVDDMMGAYAYVQSRELHRLLQEEPVIDTAYLKVDTARLNEIYIRLKETPVVAAISVKRLFVQSFKSTFAEMIVVFTQILIGFAISISGAVLYNISRITLSEKSWELASLRTLGFDVSTVFSLLFVQIGVQVLIAAIPGLLMGYVLSYLSTHWIQADLFIFPLVIEASTYGGAIFVVFLTYLVSGGLLYRKVEKISMTEALKARE